MAYDSNGVWTNLPSYHVNTGDTLLPSSQNPVWEDAATNGFSAVLVKDGRAPMTGNLNMGTTNKITNLAAGTSPTDAVNKTQLDPIAILSRGQIFGLKLSNNTTDATNDIDIAIGDAASDDAIPSLLSLASALTKRMDAAWAAGNNQGGWLDGASMPNGTGHVFIMSGASGVDVGVSASLSPILPAGYNTAKRRIGSILREGGAIVAFTQDGDIFRRAAKVDRNSTAALASSLLTLSIPTGIRVQPILQSELTVTAANSAVQNAVGSASEGSATITFQAVLLPGTAGATTDRSVFPAVFTSNTAAQVYYAVTISAGSINSNTLSTIGWIDGRGRS
ncbi:MULTISPECIES: hypothetical protein [unclassified Sinorhizobium]|uniref:hypothetical protein n=1 Tax=unclassified Sinorhizobium TaxID=2613772 RepID=UPI0035247C84